jgi:hypothetical protein
MLFRSIQKVMLGLDSDAQRPGAAVLNDNQDPFRVMKAPSENSPRQYL